MDNSVLKTIAERKSARGYLDKPLPKELTDELIKAALCAPSAVNAQPYRITVVTNRETILQIERDVCDFYEANGPEATAQRNRDRGGKVFYDAPVVLFFSIMDTKFAKMDIGMCVQNVALAAKSLGLESVILGMPCVVFEDGFKTDWKKELGFLDGYQFGLAVAVGYSDDKKPPHEPDFNKVIYVS